MREYSIFNDNETGEIRNYMKALESMSTSTDDYLYLWEIEADRNWFFGNIGEKYHLMDDGKCYCTIEEWSKNVHSKDLPKLVEDLNMVIRGDKNVHDMEYRMIDRDGNYVWVSCRGNVIRTAEGNMLMIGRVSDMALRHKVDALTGMFNHVKMKEDLVEILHRGQKGFLVILGIDNLKTINIKNGVENGNQALKFFRDVLEKNVSQRTYRLERDYFAFCLTGGEQAGVQAVYHEIQDMVSPYFTVSGGAVAYSGYAGIKSEKLYQYAEYALDKAKKEGKNRLEFFSMEDYQKEVSSIKLLEELKRSVNKGCTGFSLVYQPQIKSGSYRLFGAEALVRYESPTGGMVMPGEFIPLLEESGLICEVGLWVLRTALKQCKEWRKKDEAFHISVNLSYAQLRQKDIKKKVLEILSESGVPGEALTLEITESMQLQNFQFYNEIFSEWKNAGIEISIDDFGTGYSSLGYLKYLEVDEIKIDRCFIKGIQNSSYNYRLLFNMIELANESQIRVCCEGVEDREELHVLEELKPRLMQGYLFSKPCNPELFEQMHFDNEHIQSREYQRHIGQVQNKYIGKLLNFRHSDILNANDIGLWIICINEKSGYAEMYVDETMRRIIGADRNLSPKECYHFWYERIRDDCYEYVNESVNDIVVSGEVVEIQYMWNHPEFGEVEVRCSGTRTEDVDGMICIEGYHRMVNDIKMTWFQG